MIRFRDEAGHGARESIYPRRISPYRRRAVASVLRIGEEQRSTSRLIEEVGCAYRYRSWESPEAEGIVQDLKRCVLFLAI
jgi:hypothetical protein